MMKVGMVSLMVIAGCTASRDETALAANYRHVVESSFAAYVDQPQLSSTTDDDLFVLLEPWGQRRPSTLEDIVQIRQSIRDSLTKAEWELLFA